MTETTQETIFALSSASGRAGVAVVRVSGPDAEKCASLMKGDLPEPRRARIRTLLDNKTNDRIDVALIVYFPAPKSFTGENIVEIQCHGGRAVVESVLELLARIEGFRPAEAGEFTRRAVENGRIDLTQAEAIADLVNAETEAQRRQALRQHEGALSDLYENWRERLINAAAWLEASIDFPDEEIPDGAIDGARAELVLIYDSISAHLEDGRRGEILRDGLHVAVVGAPNAGKSSLVNALAQREVAIVADSPGTTRDVIEVRLDLKGFPVILSDTAGLRQAVDQVEAEGVRRARARATSADVRILVVDSSAAQEAGIPNAEITVLSKADLLSGQRAKLKAPNYSGGLWISTKTGEGIDELIDLLTNLAAQNLSGDSPPLTRARHRYALEEALPALKNAVEGDQGGTEIIAEEVRVALRALGRITGRVDLDEVLDVVFKDFCIGK
jgi:tRNA modification GTPase